jgi:hypothetical protein
MAFGGAGEAAARSCPDDATLRECLAEVQAIAARLTRVLAPNRDAMELAGLL